MTTWGLELVDLEKDLWPELNSSSKIHLRASRTINLLHTRGTVKESWRAQWESTYCSSEAQFPVHSYS